MRCIRQRKRISHEMLSPLSFYKNLNTRAAQWLLKSDPIAILRLLIFHKGYRNLPECIELRGADVLLAFPQIGPTTGIQKSFCVGDILPTVSCLGFIFSVYWRASALARMCDSLRISAMYCINLDECHVSRMCTCVYIYTCAYVVHVKLMYYTRRSHVAQSKSYSTNDDEVVSRMIKSRKNRISCLCNFWTRKKERWWRVRSFHASHIIFANILQN